MASGKPLFDSVHDVLVIGAGPAGSSCAYWLAKAGFDIVVVERKHFPREKTCGDGLTPRAIKQLSDMGLLDALSGHHRYDGLRAHAYGRTLELPWPQHPRFPSWGLVVTRHDLDALVAHNAAKAGATLLEETEALEPLFGDERPQSTTAQAEMPRPFDIPAQAGVPRPAEMPRPAGVKAGRLPRCSGALVQDRRSGERRELKARFVVVADGSNSRIGRSLGASRGREHPLGMAVRTYYRSERSQEPWIESHLDLRGEDGKVVPGYGWVFPLGDGRINVGAGLLSTSGRWKGVNTSKLMDSFVAKIASEWDLRPETRLAPPTGGKLPMGLSVRPRIGENVVLIGDAAGSINPFNGEGIAYGYETGRLAALCIAEELTGVPVDEASGASGLSSYDARLEEAFGVYHRTGELFVKAMEHPALMRTCVQGGLYSRTLMEWVLEIMANLMSPETRLDGADLAYKTLASVSSLALGR
jgi:flavin-dependent dehydrogenase